MPQTNLERLGVTVAVVVSVGGAAVGVTSWVWSQSGDVARREIQIERNRAAVEEVGERLEEHIENAAIATKHQDQAIRALGALQLEQGADQRSMLLELTPRPSKFRNKPPALEEAEKAVRRQ